MEVSASSGAATANDNSPAVLALWLSKQPWFCCLARLQPTAANTLCRIAAMREPALPSLLLRGVVVLAPSRLCRASRRYHRRREQSPGRCERRPCIRRVAAMAWRWISFETEHNLAVLDSPSTRRPRPHAGRPGGRQRRVHGKVPESDSNRVWNCARNPGLGQGRCWAIRRKV